MGDGDIHRALSPCSRFSLCFDPSQRSGEPIKFHSPTSGAVTLLYSSLQWLSAPAKLGSGAGNKSEVVQIHSELVVNL